jgi:hypothetical protein
VVITNEDITEVVRIKRAITFQWYMPKDGAFGGIDQKSESFNGIDPNFPYN